MLSHHIQMNPSQKNSITDYDDSAIPMSVLYESSRSKRNHISARTSATLAITNDPDNPPSPQHGTPPPKRERSDSKPSAKPDGSARERGET
jgi:hypothetical protein